LELDVRGSARASPGAVTPLFSTTVGHEEVRRFDGSGAETPSLGVRRVSGVAALELTLSRQWTVAAGVRFDAWNSEEGPEARTTGGLSVRVERAPDSNSLVARMDGAWSGLYRRVAAEAQKPLRLGSATITPEARVGWGLHLPSHLTFPLGGDRGFPGLHIGEGTGDRELLFRVGGQQPVIGPIRVRLEVASGITRGAGPNPSTNRWLVGARLGLAADTFFGPISAGFGRTHTGREALFIRFGTWL
jgi:hypothetical protein